MKIILIIFLLFNILIVSAQNRQSTKFILGTIIDSLTNEAISFVNISMDSINKVIADIDGNFKIDFSAEKDVVLVIKAEDETKHIPYSSNSDSLIIKLRPVPHDFEKDFIIKSQPTDTFYYKNKQILQINYQQRDRVAFYQNGKMQLKMVNGSYREWYKNGQLKYQSILDNLHLRTITEWYENGHKKAYGTVYWGENKKTNAGDWFNNNDWIYWDRNGKKIKHKKTYH